MNLDLGFKLAFIDCYFNLGNAEYAYLMYSQSFDCIHADDKELLKKETQEFVAFVKNSISNNKCKIPELSNFPLLNQSHVDALKLFLGFDIDYSTSVYDYHFFENKGIEKKYIRFAVYEILKFSKQAQMLFVWPSTLKNKPKRKEALQLTEEKFNVVYSLKIRLNYFSFYQLLYLLYKNFEFQKGALLDYKDGFVDNTYKCFGRGGETVIFFIIDSSDRLLDFKRRELRDFFNIGFHSAHTCDNKIETLPIAKQLLNDASRNLILKCDFTKNAYAIDFFLNTDKHQVYDFELYRKLLEGYKIELPNQCILKTNNSLIWENCAFFYNETFTYKKINSQRPIFNPYRKFHIRCGFIKIKSRVVEFMHKKEKRKGA